MSATLCSALAEQVEAALEQSGLKWTRRESGWAIPAHQQLSREIQIAPDGDGVSMHAVLVQWDEIGLEETAALTCYLSRACENLRFARCALDERRAFVSATCTGDEMEDLLPHCIGGVAAAVQVLHRQIGALLTPNLARAYLRFADRPTASGGDGRRNEG